MKWIDVERAFSRALFGSFSKRKLALTFPVLVACGLLIVFCRAVAFQASEWVSMSLSFLPMLLSAGLLLALGVVLVRMHLSEARGGMSMQRLLVGSMDLVVGTAYLSIPSIVIYLFLWMALGFFFLLKELPGVGGFFSVVFSFGPFLLIFGSLLLCFLNLGVLFFIAPIAAQQPFRGISRVKKLLSSLRVAPLAGMALFLLALLPIGVILSFLVLAAHLTDLSYLTADGSLALALEWFFIMIPFCAILTPAVILFFNFAAEVSQLERA